MADTQVVSQQIKAQIEALNAYWTEDAMREAIPIDLPSLDGTLRQLSDMAADAEPWAQSAPSQQMPSVAAAGEFVDHGNLASTVPTAAAGTFTTTLVPTSNFTKFPWQAVGKLYMVFGGKNYVGSAWAIAGTQSCIFTAGHCVYDKADGWATNVMFKGRYNNGASIGTWYIKELFSLKGWTDNRDFQYDMGACLATSAITPTMGALGWMANFPPNQGPYTGIGYPAASVPGYNFNGQLMWQSIGDYINGTNPIQAYNNMTGGCSGGPWAVVKNGVPYASGLNSFRYTSNPSTMYSPYFGDGFLNLFNAIKGK